MTEPHHHADHEHAEQEHHEHEHHEHEHHEHEHHHEHVLSYADAIRFERAQADELFRTHPDSPVPPTERATFPGLAYFDVDESLRFEGLVLEPYAGSEPSTFQMLTTTGMVRQARRAGTFRFQLGGAEQRLTGYAFEHDPEGALFVPVIDGTSGRETYGAGRYLDLEREDDGTYTLDFNLLYHPSCVYDPKYSCPLTPAENRLPIRIEAGMRL